MEIKFMGTRIGKLARILFKIAIMGLIMAGIVLINKKYMSDAEGSEKCGQKTSIEREIKPKFNIEPDVNKIHSIMSNIN
tara:strand:+ start:1529 stop:1765 length:237 start_codon:yes stop_codon:yes gene_type:complete